jgi:CRP-like cAMP-binding protein
MATIEHTPRGILKYFPMAVRVAYRKNEVIIRPDEEPAGVYYVEGGFIKAYTIGRYGERNVLLLHKQGELFPLPWGFDGRTNDVFYEAATYADLRRIDRDELLKKIATDQAFAQVGRAQLLTLLDLYGHRIQNLELRTASERLAYRLIILAGRFGLPRSSGIVIDAPVTHQDIADSLNLSRETVTRELLRMEKIGLIEQHRQLTIIDLAGLKALIA